jgi:hypothetical protein
MLETMEPPELQKNGSRLHIGKLNFTLPRQGVTLFRLHW